ncbi:MAG: tetratricopeptide repeat protein [Candidatus Coatesbacteria bacterium]|nr:tetratricopeptide repeat protein [Candidatus Coatesbacteria bacterium]
MIATAGAVLAPPIPDATGRISRVQQAAPLRTAKRGWLTPLTLFLVCCLTFLILLSTLSPSVHTGDSGELITSAWSLGIAHNPGYPVYSLIGRAFGFMGLGSPAFRVNLLSVVCAVFASVLLFLTVHALSGRVFPSAAAALLLPISATIWWQSSDAEVYILYLLSLSVLAYLLARFLAGRDIRWLYCASFIFGLSLGNHVSLVMMVPAIVCLLWGSVSVRSPKAVFVCLMLLVFGLSCYAYLPIRAAINPAMNWSAPDTLQGVIYHVGATEHRGKAVLTTGYESSGKRFASIIGLFARQYGAVTPVFLIIAFWGLWSLRRNRGLIAAAALAITMNIFYVQFINVVPLQATGFGYPSYLVLLLLFAAGLLGLVRKAPRVAVAAAVCIFVAGTLANYQPNDRSADFLAYNYGRNLIGPLPPGAALFAKGDNQIFSLLYLQSVEGLRPDVSLYDAFGDTAIALKSFTGFRDVGQQPKIEQICGANDACFFGFTPDEELGARAKEAKPVGIMFGLGDVGSLGACVWGLYELQGIDDPRIFKRILEQEIASDYHFRRARHQLARGNRSGWERELALTSLSGADVDFMRAKVADEYSEAGMTDDAIREFQAARAINPYQSDYSNQLGVLFRKLGRDAEAIEAFRAALAIKPDESVYAYNLGNALSGAGRIDEAISFYAKALSGATNPAEIHNNLGQAYRRKGEVDQAIKHFQEAIRLDPKYVAPRLNLGVSYANAEKYDLAINEYQEALKIQPDSKEVHNNLGTAYKRTGQIRLAIEHFKQAAEIDPKFLAARVNLGSTYAQLGAYELAIPHYQEVIRIDPNYASGYFDLGAIYLNQSSFTMCRKTWARFLELEPNGARAQHVRAILARINAQGG